MWFLWLQRNRCLFDNEKPYASLLISKIESSVALLPVPKLTKKRRKIGPKPPHYFPVGYFDGTAQLNVGGAGFMIYLSETHYFRFSLGCGLSTNTRAELLALWSILRVSFLMGIPIQRIYGDSMVIISWVNGLTTLEIATLKHWCDDILQLRQLVPSVSFNHIFREHNMLADGLSKKALNLEVGSGHYTETLDGKVMEDGQFTLF